MSPSSAIKRRLHLDIVSDRALHAWVLNLYLNGEQYPQRVADYFPFTADASLNQRMEQHMRDESRHVALYSKALQKLERSPQEIPLSEVFNHVVRSHTPADFSIREDDEPGRKMEKLAHFFAHVHFIEKRVLRSLDYHLDACAQCEVPYVAKAVSAVHRDEGSHVAYTREVVFNLLTRSRAMQVLAIHAAAERQASIEFSARHLRQLVSNHARCLPGKSKIIYQACANLLGLGAHA